MEEFIEFIKRRLKKSDKCIVSYDKYEIEALLNIIDALKKENVIKSNYIKELEEQHIRDCKTLDLYMERKNAWL